VLFDIGEERSAISAAEALLANPRLEVEDRAFAHILIALCNSHVGELDTALKRLTQAAYPLASIRRGTLLLSQVMWAQGLTYIRLMLFRRNPELFRGWPDMPPILEPMPSAEHVLSLFDQAQAALPEGRQWPYLELGSLFARALSQETEATLAALFEFSERYIATDPPLAARSLFCIGVVLRKNSDPQGALTVLENAVALADPLQATSIVRDVLLHISRIHEGLGNSALALAAFKRYANFTLRSLLVPHHHGPFGLKEPVAEARLAGPQEVDLVPLRNLEPAWIRSATSFIAESVGTRISVGDVVDHCKVSRRTLETAFKRYKLRTVAQCIKQAKIERAGQNLLHTRLPVRDIASSVGYASPTAFSQDFKAYFGKSPLKWREDPH
jgi:AraC-like DNA-binding protein